MKVFFVNKRLAFGSAVTTWQDAERLREFGITHIINLRWSQNSAKVRQFRHIWLRFYDDKKPRPHWFYREVRKFYLRAVKRRSNKVFVMCHHGLCRSASLTYFSLCVPGKSREKAERKVVRARPTAHVVPTYRESGERYLRCL